MGHSVQHLYPKIALPCNSVLHWLVDECLNMYKKGVCMCVWVIIQVVS